MSWNIPETNNATVKKGAPTPFFLNTLVRYILLFGWCWKGSINIFDVAEYKMSPGKPDAFAVLDPFMYFLKMF